MGKSHQKAMKITYVKGDATAPLGSDRKVIVHVCNDLGKWGKGFVLAISKRWKEPEKIYRAAYTNSSTPPALGDVQLVKVAEDILVANLIGQHGIKRKNTTSAPPIRYDAVKQGLEKVACYALDYQASVHMPRIGCGLAGGEWEKIVTIIEETLIDVGVETTVYDL